MIVSIIAAVAANGVIGRGGDLPWRLPDDLRFFKRVTMGHHLVMGRKTWASIGRPLPGRTFVVLSRDPALAIPGVRVVHDLTDALAVARAAGESEAFVIGGAEVFERALPLADRLYLTRVHADVEGDVRSPALAAALAPTAHAQAPAAHAPAAQDESPARGQSVGPEWVEVAREEHAADDRHAHAFSICTLERRAAPTPTATERPR